MSLRYRRTIKLTDGLRMNLGHSGASFSLGARGIRETLGRRGLRTTLGLAGTGLSYTRTRTRTRCRKRRPSSAVSTIAGLIILGTLLWVWLG